MKRTVWIKPPCQGRCRLYLFKRSRFVHTRSMTEPLAVNLHWRVVEPPHTLGGAVKVTKRKKNLRCGHWQPFLFFWVCVNAINRSFSLPCQCRKSSFYRHTRNIWPTAYFSAPTKNRKSSKHWSNNAGCAIKTKTDMLERRMHILIPVSVSILYVCASKRALCSLAVSKHFFKKGLGIMCVVPIIYWQSQLKFVAELTKQRKWHIEANRHTALSHKHPLA